MKKKNVDLFMDMSEDMSDGAFGALAGEMDIDADDILAHAESHPDKYEIKKCDCKHKEQSR